MNWVAALEDTWRDHAQRAPMMGVSDCCQFVADYYRRATGNEPPIFDYNDDASAQATLAQFGGIENLFTSILGDAHMPAQEGDIVACRVIDGVISAGVFNGQWVLCVAPGHGPARLRTGSIISAWSV